MMVAAPALAKSVVEVAFIGSGDPYVSVDGDGKVGALGNDIGILGHGLGMQLTEWPSTRAHDHTPLVPGMVFTLEPGMVYIPEKSMVHEENIVITESGAESLSTFLLCPLFDPILNL